VSVEQQMVAVARLHAGLAALVAARIYPLVLPQSPTLPAVVYQRISGPRVHAIGSGSFLASPRIQWSCWATTYAGAKVVADELRAALDGVLGSMNDYDDPDAQWMAQEVNDLDDYDPITGHFRVIVDFVATHDEV